MTRACSLFLAAAVAALPFTALGADNPSEAPKLRAEISVTSEIVRIGDVLENAGPAASIAIYRAPDPGTTGSLPVAALLNALRNHQVIGVETSGLRDISVTRLGRTVPATQIEAAVSQALAQRMAIADAASLTLTYDREIQPLQLDVGYTGQLAVVASRIDPRGRFDVSLEIASDSGAPMRMRYSGSAVDTVEAVVLLRAIERGETIKASDVSLERRPRHEAGADAASKDRTIGMQARRALRANVPLRGADLAKPDLVQRDQSVTLIYQTAGIYLTGRSKALENGTEGDVVSVTNLMSKRTVTGIVTGRNQVTIAVVSSQPPATVSSVTSVSPVAVASAATR